jgi:hypothetical protein
MSNLSTLTMEARIQKGRCSSLDGAQQRIEVNSYLSNVKEHAPLSARPCVDHGLEVRTTEDHENRAADRGCCVSTCSASDYHLASSIKVKPFSVVPIR